MPKFNVQLARIVRETALVVVEAPSREELDVRLAEAYEACSEDLEWEPDVCWGCEEGTHMIVDGMANPETPAEFTLPQEDDEED